MRRADVYRPAQKLNCEIGFLAERINDPTQTVKLFANIFHHTVAQSF